MVFFEKHRERKGRMKVLLLRLMPFILCVTMFKIFIWYLEYMFGFENPDFGGLLTIIGIVLGLVLATQLPFAVSKYKEANDNLDNTRAILWNISNLLIRENVKKDDRQRFVSLARDWLEDYRSYLKDMGQKRKMIYKFRVFSQFFSVLKSKYRFSEEKMARIDEWLCLMSRFMSGEDSLKTIRTPGAYYDIMRIGIFAYVLGLAVENPGFVGLFMTIFTAFFFGSMYVLAVDFDDPFGHGRHEIVDVDIDTPISDGQRYISDEF